MFGASGLYGSSGSSQEGDSAAVSAYLGQVATGSVNNSGHVDGYLQMMSRSQHFARDDITSLMLCYPNFKYSESAINGIGTIEAAIEYPIGTITRITFGGSDVGSIPIGGMIYTDTLPIVIPNAAEFYIRTYFTNPAGVIYSTPGIASRAIFNVTAPNLVMGGAVGGAVSRGYTPIAILGMTNKPTVAIVGDSIGRGSSDGATGLYNGFLSRMLSPSYACITLAADGEAASTAAGAAFAKRGTLIPYVTHVVCNYGHNDILNSSRSAAQLTTDLNTFFAKSYFAGKKIYQTTILPKSTSTDSWATEANQTPIAANSVRNTFNQGLFFDALPTISGVIDVCAAGESRTTNGIWQAPDGQILVADGYHPARRGNIWIATRTPLPVLTH